MGVVLRAIAIYVAVYAFMRVSGKRTLAQVTLFDFVLLLIVAEAVQQAVLGNDYSLTTALLAIITFITLDRVAAHAAARSDAVDRVLNDAPLILVEHGRPHEDRMRKLPVTLEDIIEQARATQGIERLDQIRYAVIERSGSISVIRESDSS